MGELMQQDEKNELVVTEANEVASSAASVTPPTMEEATAIVSNLYSLDSATVFDVLSMAIAAQIADPIIARVKCREQIVDLVKRVVTSVKLLTSVGNKLEVEVDGSPVAVDTSIDYWDDARLSELVSRTYAAIDRLTFRAQTQAASEAIALKRVEALTEEVKTLKEGAANASSIHAAQLAEALQRNSEVRSELDKHTDTGNFVVARINPTTGVPVMYLAIDGNKYVGVDQVTDAEVFTDYATARKLRVQFVIGKKSRCKTKEERRKVSASYSVMQIAVRPVTSEDMGG